MTQIPSADFNVKNIIISIVLMAIVMGVNVAYAKAALDFTLTPQGIPFVQNHTGRVARAFFYFETEMGGGKELIALSAIGFIFMKRERFFYFFFMYGLYGIIVGYYKL